MFGSPSFHTPQLGLITPRQAFDVVHFLRDALDTAQLTSSLAYTLQLQATCKDPKF